MKSNLLHINYNKHILVFIELNQNGKQYFAGTVNIENNNLYEFKEYKSLSEIVKKKGTLKPYLLHLNGFGILSRKVENAPNFKENLIVSGDESDFLFNYITLDGQIAVSFIRASIVEPITDELNQLKVFCLGVFLGPIPFITSTKNITIDSEYLIKCDNGKLLKFEKQTAENKVKLIQLFQSNVIFPLYKKTEDNVQCKSQYEFETTKKNFKEFRRFIHLGLGIIIFFLSSLTFNYFYLNHLNQVIADKEIEVASFGPNFSFIEKLTQEKNRKIQLYENSGIQKKQYISFYLDQIGASLESGITLQEIEVFPLTDPLKPKQKLKLDSNTIRIIGQCKTNIFLDDWMEKLENFNWIKSVELKNYVREGELNAIFELKILIF